MKELPSSGFVDTDVLIRLLTGDDPAKQERAYNLFQLVERGEVTVMAPDTVIADAVYVLSSPRLYGLPPSQVASLLTSLIRLRGFHVENHRIVLAALDVYGSTEMDFGDAMIVAGMRLSGVEVVYSYDRGFDNFSDLSRHEP